MRATESQHNISLLPPPANVYMLPKRVGHKIGEKHATIEPIY